MPTGSVRASMLFWRYVIAILALGVAATLAGLKLSQAWRDGAWRVVLLGATLGAGQTLCFWESIKTLETSVAVLLFYTYPAITVALDRLVFGHAGASAGADVHRRDSVRGGADHRAGAARRHDSTRAVWPGHCRRRCSTRLIWRSMCGSCADTAADRRGRAVCRHGRDIRFDDRLGSAWMRRQHPPAGHGCCSSGSAPAR